MKTNRIQFSLLLLFLIIPQLFSQTEDFNERNRIQLYLEPINVTDFKEDLLKDAILYELNNELSMHQKAAYIPQEVLINAANDYAAFMGESAISKPDMGGAKLSLQSRLESYGGALNQTTELATKANVQKGKDTITYEAVAKDIIFSFFNGKYASDLQFDGYIFIGIGAKLGTESKKVYVSIILGNYNTLNKGVSRISSFPQPLNTSTMKLGSYDAKICKKVDRYPNIDELLGYLRVDENNNRIFFETDDWKTVGKLFKLPTDAIAVDIVQWEQYPCLGENITNNALFSKGIVTKPIYQKKFIKLNEYKDKEAKTKFKIQLGVVPENAKSYELNLVIVQDKHVCKNIHKTQKIEGDISSNTNCNIIGDTLSVFNKFKYHPTADTAILKFRVPFALGKSEYDKDDIAPFLNALNEPEYIPLKIKVTAFSSIEGEEETNTQLRENRASSIIEALKTIKNTQSLPTNVVTSNSWELFYTDIIGTRFAGLQGKTKEEIRTEIDKTENATELEALFSRHRFALVEMTVKYDISNNEKEQAYVLNQFHKALDSGDVAKALSIQKYIIPKVKQNKYSKLTIDKMDIPKDSVRFSGLQMNKLWLDYTARDKAVDTAFWMEVLRLDSLDSDNDYITYNKIFCNIKFSIFKTEDEIDQIQNQIEALLTKSLSKPLLDALNLELQIKALVSLNDELNVSSEEEFMQSKLDKIKTIIELDENDWTGALNLANLFIKMKDYKYSMQLLKPFIRQRDVDETLLFTFIALCSHTNYMHHTEIYEIALKKAAKYDKERICKYFDDGQLSFQFMENPNVKKLYCTTCEY